MNKQEIIKRLKNKIEILEIELKEIEEDDGQFDIYFYLTKGRIEGIKTAIEMIEGIE